MHFQGCRTMRTAKFIHRTIFSINKEEFELLEQRFECGLLTPCDEQLFIYEKEEGHYIGIDNTTAEMFMEDFTIEDDAIIWLLDLKTSEVLKEAEKQDFWW